MTFNTAIKIIELHGIVFKACVETNWLKVLSEYTLNGKLCSEWVDCPRKCNELYDWLGY